MSLMSPQVQSFLDHAAAIARAPALEFSAHERFQLLLGHGLAALSSGSYGIAACYVVRGQGLEIGLFGRNTLAQGDPHGHAEMNAVRQAARLLQLTPEESTEALRELVTADAAFIRPLPSDTYVGTELFSTLEPCPMCTVNAINAGVNAVTFAHDDVLAGALAEERRERLGPLWARAAAELGLQVRQCQSDDPQDATTYVPSDLLDTLVTLFEVSREPLDRQLVERGFFHPEELLSRASRLLTRATAERTG